MPDLSGLGDLVVTVGGDITPLTSALDQIPAAAQSAASEIQAAFDALPSATEGVNQSLANLSTGLSEAGAAATETAGHVGEIPPALHDTSEAAGEAGEKLHEFVMQGLELAGIVLSMEALKEATVGALETFGEFQRAGEALTAITKNATGAADAMERIPALANALGVSITSLEQAQQKFALFGVDLEAMPPLFEAIANASVASGNGFDAVASSFERMDNTGKVMARTLQAAGLNMNDLAKAMDMEGASSKEVTKAFADLGEGAEGAAARAQVLIDATEKMAGVAKATANDVTGSWNQMKNAVHEAMVNIGEALSQLSQAGGMSVLKTAIAGVETFVVSLIGYLGQAIDLVKGFSSIAVDEFTALGKAATDAAHGQFAQAWADIKAGDEKMVMDFGAMSTKMQADWDANGKIIDKIWADTSTAVNTSSGKIGDGLKGAADAAGETADAVTNAGKAVQAFVGPVYQANLGIQMYSGATKDATDRTAQMVDGIEVLNGTVSPLTDTFDAAKVTIIGAGDAFSQTAADLIDYINQTDSATAATDSLTSALETAGSAAESLGSQLDQSMATASEGGGTLGMHVSLKPGDQYTQWGIGLQMPQMNDATGSPTGWGQPSTLTFDPVDYAKQLARDFQQRQQANAGLNTAATNLTSAAQAQLDAANKAADAAKMASVAAQVGTTAASAINASALAAADAANQQASDNAAFASVITQTSTVTAATVQALALATNTMVGAASVITAVAVKAGVPLTSNTMTGGSVLGSLNLPNVSTGSGLSASTGGMPFAPPVFQSGPNSQIPSVNITGGPQFVQSLMNEFVKNLQTQGIRLTRG